MSAETFYCNVQTRAASWYVDPEPGEYCENEVKEEGEPCTRHEADARDDYDRERLEEEARDDARFDS